MGNEAHEAIIDIITYSYPGTEKGKTLFEMSTLTVNNRRDIRSSDKPNEILICNSKKATKEKMPMKSKNAKELIAAPVKTR